LDSQLSTCMLPMSECCYSFYSADCQKVAVFN
jgi:hypothetical protein